LSGISAQLTTVTTTTTTQTTKTTPNQGTHDWRKGQLPAATARWQYGARHSLADSETRTH
jgi:hypothetical protein